jgi:hypothetical protein
VVQSSSNFCFPQHCSPVCERVWLISLAAKNRHTRRHSAQNGFYERNPMHISQLICKQRLHICLREFPETHMGTLHLSCAVYFRPSQTVCTKYASDFLASGLMQYVVLKRIWARVSILLTTNHDYRMEVPDKVSGPVYPASLWQTKTCTLLSVSSWRLGRWVTNTHIRRGKHTPRETSGGWGGGGGLSQMKQVENLRVCLFVKFFFFFFIVATETRYWHLSKISWSFHNQKILKIIVLNDFEVLLQHSSGRFQVKWWKWIGYF